MHPSSPILVLDSGLGGLTVARAIHAALPHEHIVYFGDTARLPYGSKSAPTVTGFMREIIGYLSRFDPKHVVIACNTATALALPKIRSEFRDLSISGVVEPGAKAAVAAAGRKEYPVIGIIATEATIRSKAYDRSIIRRRHHARLLLRPTPLLVPMIEEGRDIDDPLVELALEQYLRPLLDRGIDVLVLGCTHYPLLKPRINAIVGERVRVIDSADQCADDVARRLQAGGLLRGAEMAIAGQSAESRAGWLKTFVTDESPRFAALASRFLGFTIDPPQLVGPQELLGAAAPVEVRQAV